MRFTVVIFIIAIAFLTFSFNQKGNICSKQILELDKSSELLTLFVDINPKGMHFYSPKWNSIGNVVKSPINGVKIDVKKFRYFNDDNIFVNIKACEKGISDIYAVCKFEINEKYIGLVIRQYSQYDESLLQLMLWDKNRKRIIKGIDLADSFGDAGWFLIWKVGL